MTYEMGKETKYLLLGHPAWQGNLDTSNPDYALRWFDEHRALHPGVRVDRVVSERVTWLDHTTPNADGSDFDPAAVLVPAQEDNT